MEFQHIPVLLEETLEGLNIQPDGVYLDATIGGAGHSKEIVRRLQNGRLIGIDQDEEALNVARQRLEEWSDKVTLVHGNFRNLGEILQQHAPGKVDGVLMDIGVSSYQIDNEARGFTYHEDVPLDMRMDQNAHIPTARDIVNTYSEKQLTEIFYKYGEERWSKRIAQFIIDERDTQPLETSFDLVKVIQKAIPKKVRMQDKHPARRVFQALRIEVNHELDVLQLALTQAADALKPRGRLCVITFHSLEDRIVKNAFRDMEQGEQVPVHIPIRGEANQGTVRRITTKPVLPSEEELERNPRAHSAKLRIVEKR